MNINSKQLNENVYQSRGDYEGHKKKKKSQAQLFIHMLFKFTLKAFCLRHNDG